MTLHIPTLAMVAVFVTAILGVLLLLAWRRDQSTSALVWWGTAYLLGAFGFALLAARGAIPDVLSIELANAAVLLSYSLTLAGARAFNGRETPPTVFLIGPLLWLTAMQIPAVAADINFRVVIITAIQCTFTSLIAYEFWRERAEPLLSRWPAIIVIMLQTLGLSLRIPVLILAPLPSSGDFFRSPAFAVMAFGTVLYTITFAFLLLSMTKERGEWRHKMASLIDSLTGLANRRAFLDGGNALVEARAKSSAPLGVLLADLDRFKAINDAFGHAVGDRVLKVFATALRHNLRAEDLMGRIGGEEFAVLLPGTDRAGAMEAAERIRRAFAQAAAHVDGHMTEATVSIGVAVLCGGDDDLATLLGRADRALYRAKADGRNRVLFGDSDSDAPPLVPFAPRVHALATVR